MLIQDVRNNHLQKIIYEILNFPDDYVDESLITDLVRELRFSTFICPAVEMGLILAGDEQSNSIPAFTSMSEYNLDFEGINVQPVSWHFSNVKDYLDDENFDGIIVNPHIDNFFISNELIKDALEDIPSFTRYHKKKSKFSDDELLEILENENKDIDEYTFSEDFSFEELLKKLSKVNLFSFVSSTDELTSRIINADDLSSQGILTINEFGGEYNLIFNSHKHMDAIKNYYDNDERTLYALPTTLELMAKYILELDLDGLILNYGLQSIRIPREILLVYINDIAEITKHEIQVDLSDYLFNL